jgi:hypothetical protein
MTFESFKSEFITNYHINSILFPKLLSTMAWNFLKTTKVSDFCFKSRFVQHVLVLLLMKVMKNQTPPIEIIFIEPHNYVCTNSKEVLHISLGFFFEMDSYIACH